MLPKILRIRLDAVERASVAGAAVAMNYFASPVPEKVRDLP
jgi:hypothetical protein